MESATEKILRLVLLHHEKSWKQVELAELAGCSKAFVSKLTKKMVSEGVLARPNAQEILLISGTKALALWCNTRKMPHPVYIKTLLTKTAIENKLRKEKCYALTLFSAAWHRVKFMKTNRIEAYVDKGCVKSFADKFGRLSKTPTNFIAFPSGKEVFEKTETIEGLRLIHVIQNYVDLASSGGTGMRVAYELGKKYNIRGI